MFRDEWIGDGKQGVDCAAQVGRRLASNGRPRVLFFYGSAHDTEVWIFTKDPPPGFEPGADPVCDSCVQPLMDDGTIEWTPERTI